MKVHLRGAALFLVVAAGLLWFHSTAKPQEISRDSRYPADWWTPVIDPNKPAWEILPQEAGPGEVILSKRHELGLLSNFAPTPFTLHGKRYASLEGFWQMMKYPEKKAYDRRARFPGVEWKYTRDQVAAMVSFEAKRAGDLGEANMKKMGISWVSFEGKNFEYKPAKPGQHLQVDRRSDVGKGEAESGSEEGLASDWGSNTQARSPSGTKRASRVALL